MKKILSATCAMMLASAGMMANAQQLPNVGFENWKETCGSSLNTSNNQVLARPGIEPSGWNGGNVNQFDVAKNDALCTQGIEENNKYLILTNKKVGLGSLTATAPGFVSLSTPWIFASFSMMSEAALKLGDGGTYGGVAFEYKPDAISLKYRKTAVNSEVSRVIAYIWNGEFVSNVPKNIKNDGSFWSPNYVISELTTLTDVDRAIIGRESSDKVLKKGTLIAKVDYEITEDKSDWTFLEIPFTYEENASTIKPEKMNVIISSGDYWNRSGLNENSTLDVDDVDFVYYSTLNSLTAGEENVDLTTATFEEGVATILMGSKVFPTEDEVSYTAKSQFATVNVELLKDQDLVKVTVSNQGGKDVDGLTQHVYNLLYNTGTSSVESVAGDGVKVYAAAGCVVVEGAEGVAQVYTADGKQVAVESVNGKAEIALANGLYIVRVGNKVQKVVVK